MRSCVFTYKARVIRFGSILKKWELAIILPWWAIGSGVCRSTKVRDSKCPRSSVYKSHERQNYHKPSALQLHLHHGRSFRKNSLALFTNNGMTISFGKSGPAVTRSDRIEKKPTKIETWVQLCIQLKWTTLLLPSAVKVYCIEELRKRTCQVMKLRTLSANIEELLLCQSGFINSNISFVLYRLSFRRLKRTEGGSARNSVKILSGSLNKYQFPFQKEKKLSY